MQGKEKGNGVVFHLFYHLLIWVIELLLLLLIFFGIIWGCQKSYQFCYEVFGSVAIEEKPGQEREFEVKQEDTMYQVAGRLRKEGLIVNQYSFYVRTIWMDENQNKLRPGIYVLNTSMDYEEIINELTMSE